MPLRDTTTARILDAADELFFTRGVQATPIDAVIARAGVSAATLYRGFASKEVLLAAALERRQRRWIETWDAAIARAEADTDRLLAVFDALEDFRALPHGSRWCAFLGTAAEFPDADAELTAAVQADTDALRRRLTDLAGPVLGGERVDASGVAVDAGAMDAGGERSTATAERAGRQRAAELAERLLLIITGALAMQLRTSAVRVDHPDGRGVAPAPTPVVVPASAKAIAAVLVDAAVRSAG